MSELKESMMDKDTLNASIRAKLKCGVGPKDIAEQLDCKIQKVYTENRKLKAEAESDLVVDAVKEAQASPEVLQEVLTEMKAKAPVEVVEELEALEVGVDGLKKLDGKFQETFNKALKKADGFLDQASTVSEWKIVMDTLAQAYESVFTKGTNIHIGDNNNMSSQRLTVFKANMGT